MFLHTLLLCLFAALPLCSLAPFLLSFLVYLPCIVSLLNPQVFFFSQNNIFSPFYVVAMPLKGWVVAWNSGNIFLISPVSFAWLWCALGFLRDFFGVYLVSLRFIWSPLGCAGFPLRALWGALAHFVGLDETGTSPSEQMWIQNSACTRPRRQASRPSPADHCGCHGFGRSGVMCFSCCAEASNISDFGNARRTPFLLALGAWVMRVTQTRSN